MDTTEGWMMKGGIEIGEQMDREEAGREGEGGRQHNRGKDKELNMVFCSSF